MSNKYLRVYLDMLPALEGLDYPEVGRLIIASLKYYRDGEQPVSLKGKEAILWPVFVSQIDDEKESHKARCETNRKNALAKANRSESQQIAANRSKSQRIAQAAPQNNINNNNYIYPTLEEVKAYAKERNSILDPVFFYDYFSTRNWIDSKGDPVRNWKNKFVTWEKKEKDKLEEQKAKEEQKPDLSWFYEDAHGIRR